MYRLVLCVPIFRGFFWVKVRKGCVYVIMLKIALVLVKNVFFGLKKGISRLLHWIAQKHTVCVIVKKLKFIKEQKARGLLSNLGIRTSLSQIPLLGCGLF